MSPTRKVITSPVNFETPLSRRERPLATTVFPFSAIVGQEELKLALILNAIDPLVGGVLIMGQRGTGKSTAVRGLAELLPAIRVVRDCIYHCDPNQPEHLCLDCRSRTDSAAKLETAQIRVPLVTLPLGATEDRVCGTIDIQRALQSGVKSFEPGLLAGANRGFLYIDEVNLLDDHLVDLLLDAAATGRNRVEREGISVEHPAHFVLIGSGNPEEGELRPQLQDRFGLFVEVTTDNHPAARMAVVEMRDAFDRNPQAFLREMEDLNEAFRIRIRQAQHRFANLRIRRTLLEQIATLCSELAIDGHRGELTITRAARALAAYEARRQVSLDDVKRVAVMSLHHRLRREALEEIARKTQIEEAVERILGSATSKQKGRPTGESAGNKNGQALIEPKVQPGGGKGGDKVEKSSPPGELSSEIRPLNNGEPGRAKLLRRENDRKSSGRVQKLKMVSKDRGRYQRAVNRETQRLALDATLRALATETLRPHNEKRLLSPEMLRYKLLSKKAGRLFIFAIDTSGSMALNRISQAKGALFQLLKKSYVNRDEVAIVAFRGESARMLLSPSRSMLRARRVLDSLSVGGGTPLSAGLVCARDVAKRAKDQGRSDIRLLIFTDGRANVPLSKGTASSASATRTTIFSELEFLGLDLRRLGVSTFVVETDNRFASRIETGELAHSLKAELVPIGRTPQTS